MAHKWGNKYTQTQKPTAKGAIYATENAVWFVYICRRLIDHSLIAGIYGRVEPWISWAAGDLPLKNVDFL